MEFKEGYAYHIKDDFFNKVKDPKLMRNKENGNAVPVHTIIQKIINNNMKQIRQLIKLNIKVVFPDVNNIEKIMLLELHQETIKEVAVTMDESINTNIEDEKDWEIER